MSQILVFDLGGSSLQLAIVNPDLGFAGHVRKPLRIRNERPGHYEADPQDWWQAFRDGCRELAERGHDFREISAVAGCGFTRTQVFLDAAGAVLRPAITFQNSRALAALDEASRDPSQRARQGCRASRGL